jgi:hypothetical protein
MFCMQEKGGKIIPPVHFLCWARLVLAQLILLMGQADPGPARYSGPLLAQKKIIVFGPKSAQSILGRNRPTTFWAESGPAGWAGPAQPNLILYYVYYLFVALFNIYIWKNYENSAKIILKNM